MRLLSILMLLVSPALVRAQELNVWHVLGEVGFKKEEKTGGEMEVPIFSAHLQTYQGKKIRLKGFMIPVSETGDESKFMLSSLPFSVCYFCGAAGPETIVEVETNQRIKFTSEAIWMEGVLYLNAADPDHHIYILKSARTIQSP